MHLASVSLRPPVVDKSSADRWMALMGVSKVVPQHAEKPIAVLGLTSEIGWHNFGDALIDSFIEI